MGSLAFYSGCQADKCSSDSGFSNDAVLFFSFAEEPRFDSEYEGRMTRQLTDLTMDAGIFPYLDRWATQVSAQTEKSRVRLSFTFATPWILSKEVLKADEWFYFASRGTCLDDEGHAPYWGDTQLLSADAGLLLHASISMPLIPDGGTQVSPGLPFELGWKRCGTSSNALLFTNLPDQAPMGVGRHTVEVGGKKWMIAIQRAAVNNQGCGNANFIVAAEGVVVRSP